MVSPVSFVKSYFIKRGGVLATRRGVCVCDAGIINIQWSRQETDCESSSSRVDKAAVCSFGD